MLEISSALHIYIVYEISMHNVNIFSVESVFNWNIWKSHQRAIKLPFFI